MSRIETARCRRSRGNAGFTLIEMIVATLLLAIGIAGTLSAFAYATRAAAYSDAIQTATMLARQQLADTELQADNISGGDQQGDFGDQYPGFTWKQSVQTTDYSNLFEVTVTVMWGGSGQQQRQRSITTYLIQPQSDQTGITGNTSSTSSSNATMLGSHSGTSGSSGSTGPQLGGTGARP